MAAEVRTGLITMPAEFERKAGSSVLDALEHKKPIRQHVREFACIFSIIALGVSGYYLHWEQSTTVFVAGICAAVCLLFLGYVTPIVLYPVWKAWMTLALALGFVVTGIVLFFMWVAIFIPLALTLRLIGKRVMDLTFDRSVSSYWNDRDEKFHDFKLLERQF